MVPSIAMNTTFKSSVNPDHVEALKQLMRENVERLDMVECLCGYRSRIFAEIMADLKDPECGTTACIAGFATILYANDGNALFEDEGYGYYDYACRYLGIERDIANPIINYYWLFHNETWPLELNRRYGDALNAENPVEAVEVACEAIDRYIAEYQKKELAAAIKGGAQ